MKKFASIFTSILLAFLLSLGTVASAASVLDSSQSTGTLTLYKYEPENNKQTAVTGATFTAYQVAELDEATTGTFKVTTNFSGVTGLSDLFDYDGGLTYKSTSEFEALIPALQSAAETINVKDNQSSDGNIYTSTEDTTKGKYTFGNIDLGIYLVVETGVPNGYITSSQSFLVSVPEWNQTGETDGTGTWNYDVVAYPKDTKLTVTKEIVTQKADTANDIAEETAPATTQAIGDVIPFKISSTIPDYGMSLSESDKKFTATLTDTKFNDILFKFNDTLSKGLTLDDSSITVTIPGAGENGQDVTLSSGSKLKTKITDTTTGETSYTDGADYTVTVTAVTNNENQPTGENKLTIDFAWAALDNYQGKNIVITYNAVLNENAAIGSANTNTVTLNYTSDPETGSDIDEDNPDDPDNPPTPPSDTTEVYTYGMDLTKTFNNEAADGTKIDASGVEFSLKVNSEKLWFVTAAAYDTTGSEWKNSGSGEYTAYSADLVTGTSSTFDDSKTTEDIEAKPTTLTEGTYVKINDVDYIITQKLNPSSTGVLNVNGLNVATYTLTEENSIDGYSKLAGDITITVSETKDANDTLTGKVTAKMGDTELENADNTGRFKLAVNNVSKQFSLPLTGGAGFIIFTVCGGIVMASAIIVFYQFRKRRAEAKH